MVYLWHNLFISIVSTLAYIAAQRFLFFKSYHIDILNAFSGTLNIMHVGGDGKLNRLGWDNFGWFEQNAVD